MYLGYFAIRRPVAGTSLECTYPTKNYLNKTTISMPMVIEAEIDEVKIFWVHIELLKKVTFKP